MEYNDAFVRTPTTTANTGKTLRSTPAYRDTPEMLNQARYVVQVGMIYGLTLRIGRFFKGSAGLIDDILFHVADSPGMVELQ